MAIDRQISEMLLNQGVCDLGFARVSDGPSGLQFALSVVLPLSDPVIEEIVDSPTHSYYHHYRTVNAYIDRLLLQTGLLLQNEGWHYLPIAASQSIPEQSERTHTGRYSHKKAAVLAGLGSIGKSTLFLHRFYGPRVRMGTLFTDCPLPVSGPVEESLCKRCDLCVKACPAGAIKGVEWRKDTRRNDLFDAGACNRYMREHFMKIGRGSVCGICIKVCPHHPSGGFLTDRTGQTTIDNKD